MTLFWEWASRRFMPRHFSFEHKSLFLRPGVSFLERKMPLCISLTTSFGPANYKTASIRRKHIKRRAPMIHVSHHCRHLENNKYFIRNISAIMVLHQPWIMENREWYHGMPPYWLLPRSSFRHLEKALLLPNYGFQFSLIIIDAEAEPVKIDIGTHRLHHENA